jgi:integrase
MCKRPDRGGWWTRKKGVWHFLGDKDSDARREFMRVHGSDEAPGHDLFVADVLDRYLIWSVANHADSTHYRIKLNVESFSKSLPPRMRLRRLLPLHLTEWLDKRCPKKPKDGSKPASDNTRHDYASDVLGAFNWAVNQRLIANSPLHGFRKAPKTGRITYLAPEQMEDLLSRIKDREFRDFLVTVLRTGCRPKEIRLLEAKHVLLKEGVARIPKNLAKGKRKERLLPLDDVVLLIIRPLVLKYPEGPLFRNTRGRPWTKNALNCRFQHLKTPYEVSAYSMRHTFITEGQKNNIPDSVLAEICGHEDTSMITKCYGHARLDNSVLRAAVEKVNQRAAVVS